MYLFSRTARLGGGNIADSIGWATAITQRVNEVGSLEASLWASTLSPGVGTVSWTAFTPDLPTLEAELDKVAADSTYLDLVGKAAEFVIPASVDDGLALILHGEPNPEREVTYVAVVRSTMTAGGLGRGIPLGIEIAQSAEKITGLPTAFLADATGNYGGVAWISGYANIGELERAQLAINGDQSFVELIDTGAPGAYTDHPGAASQVIYRRLA